MHTLKVDLMNHKRMPPWTSKRKDCGRNRTTAQNKDRACQTRSVMCAGNACDACRKQHTTEQHGSRATCCVHQRGTSELDLHKLSRQMQLTTYHSMAAAPHGVSHGTPKRGGAELFTSWFCPCSGTADKRPLC